jgi:two-component system, OmpR family, sensor histidine kinase BaeS
VVLHHWCDAGLPSLHADPDRLAQVLSNLLDNALRHTQPGGRVSVTAGARNGTVEVAVSDSGDGIPAEELPHVFERLYRTDAARDQGHGGSGIGLAIVRALVDAHGGQVEAASPGPSGGAAFTVTLPAAG